MIAVSGGKDMVAWIKAMAWSVEVKFESICGTLLSLDLGSEGEEARGAVTPRFLAEVLR